MPELPEVETVRRGLASRLNGFEIKYVEVRRERAIASPGGSFSFEQNLPGLFVGEWIRRGKYLIASLHQNPNRKKNQSQTNKGGWLVVHLRMTGYFQWHSEETAPCPHTRVRIWNPKDEELRFVDMRSFGQMWWIPPHQKPESVIKGLGNLGPEPFSKEFNANYLLEKFKKSNRPIKSSLLDQSLVAGAGNIYADESLFAAGIKPQTPSCKLKKQQLENLCNSLKTILEISIGVGGTTFSDFRDLEGLNGNYGGQAWIYRRANKTCRKCGARIMREKISGRSSHWCPSCQV